MAEDGEDAVTDDGAAASVVPIRPPAKRTWYSQWPISLVLLGVVFSMGLIASDYFRRGCVVLSASVLLAAFLRLLLPEEDAGWLAVRSRRIDVLILGLLGIGLSIFAFWVPAPSY